MTTSGSQILVADIGGTNARFAVACGDAASLDFIQQFPSASFESLLAAVKYYVDGLPCDVNIAGACLAVAGPVTAGSANLTNLGWQADELSLTATLGFPVKLINDFVAYAYSVPQLPQTKVCQIRAGEGVADAPMVVLGPGTGFGVASLRRFDDCRKSGWRVTPCEGGHTGLAASSELQLKLLTQLHQTLPFVNVESVLCGSGMVNLYRAMAAVTARAAELTTPAQITEAAATGDQLAQDTVIEFCNWLGSISADMVLAQGARGGVWLGGGILPRIAATLTASDFNRCFVERGLMADYLAPVPVTLALKSDTALNGAAGYFYDRKGEL